MEVYVVDAVRTPVGRFGGGLSGVRVDDLAIACVNSVLERAGCPAEAVEDMMLGCINTSGEAAGNLGRNVVLAAGLPLSIPGTTINRYCGSGLAATNLAASVIAAGQADVVVAGGAESMSRGTWIANKPAGAAFPRGAIEFQDGMMGGSAGPRHPTVLERGWAPDMPTTALNVARRYSISRGESDAFAARSHSRAAAARDAGRFADEILSIGAVAADEGIRETTLDKLAALPSIRPDLPDITAGNSSPLNDGASALLLASAAAVERHGWRPLARIVSTAVVGCDPLVMGLGPAVAIPVALRRAGIDLDDVDLVEINEAFAAQVLGCLHELPVDEERLNVNGGAIALGHALGNSGSRILATLVHELRRRRGRYGVASLCIGGGQGIATVVESVAG